MTTQMYKTPRKQLPSGEWICATFGLTRTNHTYMSVTGEVWATQNTRADRNLVAYVSTFAEINHAFPELAECLRFHLVDSDGVPMHYLANAKFWHDLINFQRPASNYEPKHQDQVFATTICFGAIVEQHTVAELLAMPWHQCKAQLEARLAPLRDAFQACVLNLPALARKLNATPVCHD